MNRIDHTVLVFYANGKAYGWLQGDTIVPNHYKELVERRYAKLMTWWNGLPMTDKRSWYAFIGQRSAGEVMSLHDDVMNTLFEFSRAFEVDEREGIPYTLSRTPDRIIYDAWHDLREDVWMKFRKAVHI